MPFLYLEIAESVRRRIAAGDLIPGDRLPAVRSLAEQWNCTPGTVNRAYRQLAEEGLVSGRRGRGTRILDNTLIAKRPELEWAQLVNRAEQYLLEALSSGHSAEQALSALSMARSRWRTLQEQLPMEAAEQETGAKLRFAGSHDLTVELLAEKLLAAEPQHGLEIEYVGSLGGLIALARGEADVAGVHLWDTSTASYNLPFVQRILPGRRLALVTLIHRKLGFIVPKGNPQLMRGLDDLTRPEVRWINRQSGSGTRIWLDEQLRQTEIRPERIRGYTQERRTHMAVAQAVQEGQATAGLGIQAAALAYGLDFVPATEETYQLVVLEALWANPAWQALLDIIRSEAFVLTVETLGGYDTTSTGVVVWV